MSVSNAIPAPTERKNLAGGKPPTSAAPGPTSLQDGSPDGAQESAWPIVPLADLAAGERNAITDGPFGSKLKTAHYTGSGPRVIRLTNIGNGEFIDAKAHISPEHFSTLQKHRVFPGDLVIAALGENPPRSCLVPDGIGDAIVKADCIRFKPGPRILPKYLNYVLNSPELRRHAKSIVHGVGRPRLNLGEIKSLPIPLPPLDQQRRIVAEIEKQFTRLDAGVAALRRVLANLKRYRASVLKAACEGRLVPTEAELARSENRSFESGDDLLARIITDRRLGYKGRRKYEEPNAPEVANLPTIPQGWAWATAEQLSDENRSITYGVIKLGAPVPNGTHVLRSSDVRHLRLDMNDVKRVSPEIASEYRRTFLKGGEVLVTVRGTLGGVVVAPAECAGFNISREVAMLALVEPAVAKLAAIFIGSATLQRWLAQRAKGIAYTGINIETLKSLPIPLPPPAEQVRIVEEVEHRLSVVDEIEAMISTNLRRAKLTRESILHSSFGT